MHNLTSSHGTVLSKSTRIERFKRLLLSVGGKDVAFQPSDDDISVPWLLESGFVMAGRIVPRIMAAGKCHLNVLTVWQRGYSGLVGIGTGYGLSNHDGNWYRHSWESFETVFWRLRPGAPVSHLRTSVKSVSASCSKERPPTIWQTTACASQMPRKTTRPRMN
jgi:hypothetical protein